jgi:hypothetical protein
LVVKLTVTNSFLSPPRERIKVRGLFTLTQASPIKGEENCLKAD